MLRTITQKCPCGYFFKETCEIEKIKAQKRNGFIEIGFKCDTVDQSKQKTSHPKKPVIESKIINGDEKFKEISVITSYDPIDDISQYTDLLICPKCGTVLLSTIAMKVEEKEE